MEYIINNKKFSIISKIGLLDDLLKLINLSSYSKVGILTDDNLYRLYQKKLKNFSKLKKIKIIIVNSGELNKNLKSVKLIWQKLFAYSFDRNSLLINFGGGMISDLGGFAAASFMRGIDFINVPTTLLAQVDASIGGKTAINFHDLKNSIGFFINPISIYIDMSTLKTLSDRELLSGFAEILKYGIIFDKKLFDFLSAKPFLTFNLKELHYLIDKSCSLKIKSIQEDYYENSSRKLLNFGHTIGHAFEAISMNQKVPLTHGEAIAIGMFIESEIAASIGLLSKQDLLKIKKIISDNYLFNLNKQYDSLEIIEKIKLDKKNRANKINWTLPKSIGKALYDQAVPQSVVLKEIYKFLDNYHKNNVK